MADNSCIELYEIDGNRILLSEITVKQISNTFLLILSIFMIMCVWGLVCLFNPDEKLKMLGFVILALLPVIVIFITVSGIGFKQVPAYELMSVYSKKVILKTFPEQDWVAILKAKEELASEIKLKSREEKENKQRLENFVKGD